MGFKIGKNFHVIHMTDDVRQLDLWYYDVFSVRRFMPESYMPAEKRDASLVLLGEVCIEPLAPAFGVDGWERMPLGRYYLQHGKRLHSLAWYVDDGMADLYRDLRAADIECRGTAGVLLTGDYVDGPVFTHPSRHVDAARVHPRSERSRRAVAAPRPSLRGGLEPVLVG